MTWSLQVKRGGKVTGWALLASDSAKKRISSRSGPLLAHFPAMSAFFKWAALASLLFGLFVRVAAAELEPSNPPVKAEITAVIEAQLAAFRVGDFDKAYTFAASPIREMFPVAEFQNMVKTGYPIIASSVKADFGICLDNGSEASVFVHVEAKDGTSKNYQYGLVREPGGWRITGVTEPEARGSRV
jgi:hypothetical protein